MTGKQKLQSFIAFAISAGTIYFVGKYAEFFNSNTELTILAIVLGVIAFPVAAISGMLVLGILGDWIIHD